MANVPIEIYKRPSLSIPDEYLDYIYDFAGFITGKLPFKQPVKIYLLKKGEKENCTTGVYEPETDSVNAVAEGRALPDIMKTVAHEMVHKKQNEQGQLNASYTPIGGFAEGEANVKAGNFVKLYVQEKNAKKIYEI